MSKKEESEIQSPPPAPKPTVPDSPMSEKKVVYPHQMVVDVADKEDISKITEEILLAEDEFTDEDYHRIKRRIDYILLPLMWWMYGIQQTDKTGLATMNLFGLQQDTHMHGKQYSYLTVLFYVAYAAFEFPANYLMQKYNVGKTLATMMLLWGIVVFGQAFLKNWAEFAALRFIQGALECTISPGFNYIISRWYTTREHSSRSLVFQSANAGWGIIVNFTFYGIAKRWEKYGGFAAWRGIEVFLGAQTLIASALAWFFLGTPNEVRWLDHKQKLMATARVMKNHAGTDQTGRDKWNWTQMKEAFLDPVLYFQFANTFLVCVMNGAITTFGTVIVQSFGFDKYTVILLDNPRNAISVIFFAIVGYSSLKVRNIRFWWMIIATAICFVCLLLVGLLPTHYKWGRMVCYWFTSIFTIPSFSAWALISSNTAGRTKISVISATTFIAYCTGNIAGSQVMKPKDAPKYIPGIIAIGVCMGVDMVLIVIWRYWLVYLNHRKAKEVERMELTPEEAERRGQIMGARDVTDLKNPFFRYDL